MKLRYTYFLTLVFLVLSAALRAQNEDVLIIRDNQMLFKINRNWDKQKVLDVAKQYSLDSSLVFQALRQKESGILSVDGSAWTVDCINTDEVCLSKQIKDVKGSYSIHNNVIIDPGTEGKYKSGAGYVNQNAVRYGLNQMKETTILQMKDGKTLFTLPGYLDAKQVIITGSFNNWSTEGVRMEKVESGWVVTLDLAPGKYLYKFIVDGHWLRDPNNALREDDGQSGYNSVHYVYNHTFSLPGYTDARKVILAMSLNDWNEKELRMTKTSRGWELPIYLKKGTHAYKYIVDGDWITDPDNQITQMDNMGNANSVVQIGSPTLFVLKGFPNAKEVRLAGSFNNWNPSDLLMKKTATGWEIPFVLGAGNYEYKFIVDGKWMRDPDNPYFAETNGEINSFIAVEPNHVFRLKTPANVKKVIVTGNFTGWSESNYQMLRKEGTWVFPIHLDPGKQVYKFIVDGKWFLDPANPLFEGNEYDTGNSILWIGE